MGISVVKGNQVYFAQAQAPSIGSIETSHKKTYLTHFHYNVGTLGDNGSSIHGIIDDSTYCLGQPSFMERKDAPNLKPTLTLKVADSKDSKNCALYECSNTELVYFGSQITQTTNTSELLCGMRLVGGILYKLNLSIKNGASSFSDFDIKSITIKYDYISNNGDTISIETTEDKKEKLDKSEIKIALAGNLTQNMITITKFHVEYNGSDSWTQSMNQAITPLDTDITIKKKIITTTYNPYYNTTSVDFKLSKGSTPLKLIKNNTYTVHFMWSSDNSGVYCFAPPDSATQNTDLPDNSTPKKPTTDDFSVKAYSQGQTQIDNKVAYSIKINNKNPTDPAWEPRISYTITIGNNVIETNTSQNFKDIYKTIEVYTDDNNKTFKISASMRWYDTDTHEPSDSLTKTASVAITFSAPTAPLITILAQNSSASYYGNYIGYSTTGGNNGTHNPIKEKKYWYGFSTSPNDQPQSWISSSNSEKIDITNDYHRHYLWVCSQSIGTYGPRSGGTLNSEYNYKHSKKRVYHYRAPDAPSVQIVDNGNDSYTISISAKGFNDYEGTYADDTIFIPKIRSATYSVNIGESGAGDKVGREQVSNPQLEDTTWIETDPDNPIIGGKVVTLEKTCDFSASYEQNAGKVPTAVLRASVNASADTEGVFNASSGESNAKCTLTFHLLISMLNSGKTGWDEEQILRILNNKQWYDGLYLCYFDRDTSKWISTQKTNYTSRAPIITLGS